MTYVYEKYDRSLARARFKDYERVDNFGWDGIDALFDHLEELATDTGTPIEFDVIALCCDYSRYESFEEFQKEYNSGDNDNYATLDEVREHTTVILIDGEDGPFIIQCF